MPPSLTVSGPRLRISICSSTVPGAATDTGRWYRFVVDAAADETGTYVQGRGQLITMDPSGKKTTRMGSPGIKQINASEGVQRAPSADLSFVSTPLVEALIPLILPMDAVHIEVNSYALGGWWTIFDGFVCQVDSTLSSYTDSVERSLRLSCACIERALQAALFNWKGIIHPADGVDVNPNAAPGDVKRLAESLEGSAKRPEEVIKAFLSSGVRTAMTLRVGSVNNDGGLPIGGYLQFADGTDFRSAFNVAIPLPYQMMESWTGVSFWNLAMSMSEPDLHEFFWSYRDNQNGPGKIPTLVFRPRPFPGLPEKDQEWKQLPRYEIGPGALPSPFIVREELSDSQRSNCFTWAVQNLGDQSSEQFSSKISVGWFFSPSLVNRYGYACREVQTKMAPLFPRGDSAGLDDLALFALKATEHVARQDMPLVFLRRRSLTFQAIPVRPGCILVDKTGGPRLADWVTGYISEVRTVLSASGSSLSMSQSVEVIRCLKGCDADGYPDAVRALVPDLQHRSYGSEVLGTSQGPPPASGAATAASTAAGGGPARAAVSRKVDPRLPDYAKAAALRQGIPPWLVMHILHQETALGTNFGSPPSALSLRNGVGQITSVALARLQEIGYTNTDGSGFQGSDRANPERCIGGVAALLKDCETQLLAGGLPSGSPSYWSWVARAYRWGVGDTLALAHSTGWVFDGALAARGGAPDFVNPAPDYDRYWSPPGVDRGRALYGSI